MQRMPACGRCKTQIAPVRRCFEPALYLSTSTRRVAYQQAPVGADGVTRGERMEPEPLRPVETATVRCTAARDGTRLTGTPSESLARPAGGGDT